MINFSLSEEVEAKFPGLTVAVVEGVCEENKLFDETAFLEEKNAAKQAARSGVALADHPHVQAWRKVFRSFGADPTKTRSSGEALLRRVQRGGELPRINAIVDIYNVISLRHVLPVGGQDAEKIAGGVKLRFAGKNENFVPLGANEPHEVDEGEVVYADDAQVLCSKWNYRDCEPAKISETTKKFVLFVDGAPGVDRKTVEKAAEELTAMLNKLVVGCAAKTDRLVGVD